MRWTRTGYCEFCHDTGILQEGAQSRGGYVVTMTFPCPHCLINVRQVSSSDSDTRPKGGDAKQGPARE